MGKRLTPEERKARELTEKALLEGVRKFAKVLGFACYHTHRSQFSEPGWPDLALSKGPRLIFAELKRELEKPSPHQVEWLNRLSAAGVETYLWRPSDWYKGEIDDILLHGPNVLHLSAWVAA